MLLKPSWSFFNKKGNKRRIQKKAPLVVILCADCIPSAHTAVVIPSYAEKGNTFRIQKKGQQLYEPSPSSLVL